MLEPSITDNEIAIDGYNVVRQDRNREGGGVLLYINNSFSFSRCDSWNDLLIEAVALKISLRKKPLIISSIYRPPSSNSEHFSNMITYMERVLANVHDTIFVGDFNLNVSKKGPDLDKVELLCNTLSLAQLISKSTRTTLHTSTCIDLLFTNIPLRHTFTDVLTTSFSDHCPIYTNVNLSIPTSGSRTVRFRCYDNFYQDQFYLDLINSPVLSNLYEITDINLAWKVFIDEFLGICDSHAPIKERRVKVRKNPWMTPEIIDLMFHRDSLRQKGIKHKDPTIWDQYIKIRNNVTKVIRKSKAFYFRQQITSNATNRKGMWDSLRLVLPSSNKSSNITEISPDTFNSFFTSVGVNLTSSMDSNQMPYIKLKPPSSTFSFFEIDQSFIFNKISQLKNKTGLDSLELDNKILKYASGFISASLAHLFNLSLYSGEIPCDWKKAVVTPIYKGRGARSDPSNYRPISITSTISKLFEFAVKEQILSYLLVNNLITPNQSAYLKNRSTSTALHTIIDEIASKANNGEVTALCTLDIAKGFDTISHSILLHKLAFYGCDPSSLKWFKSCLTGRTQTVKCNNYLSSELQISIGVPQGSVLGPFLFIIYMNDLPTCMTNGVSHSFADDSSMAANHKTICGAQNILQDNLNNASNWFNSNKLVVNPNKSNVILIGPKSKVKDHSVSVTLNGIQIQQSKEITLLGLQIDNNLNFHSHINALAKKLSSKVGLLHRLGTFLPSNQLIMIYSAIIQSLIDYGITLWGSSHKTYLNSIQRMQNRCARICTNTFDHHVSSSSLIKKLQWMDITSRYKYFVGIFMYKYVFGLQPPSLNDHFSLLNEVHNYPTRGADNNNFLYTLSASDIFKRNMLYVGPKTWNSIPTSIKNSPNIAFFKATYKSYLLNNNIIIT